MKELRKGFTLIELLAVIVILAIIAVIATPIMLGVIDNARKSSYINSSHGIIDAANKFVITTELTGNLESNYEFDLTTDELTFSGNKPSSGTLLIDRLQNVSLTLKYGNYCIEKKFNESEPTIKNKANCVIDNSEILLSKMYKERILNGTDPVISGNLIPVTIENDGSVYKSSVNDSYYSYEAKRWANAIIPFSTATDAVNDLAVGEEINENQIESYFVWIPRYKYQLWHTTNTGTYGVDSPEHSINIMFENKDYPVSSGSNNGEWLTHPAFTSFNTNGIWVGKFETGYKGATSLSAAQQNNSSSSNIIVKSNVYSWRVVEVANAFLASYNYKRALESHMMKNTEWGAVSYLSHSAYGMNSNIRSNNNSDLLTGYAYVSSINQMGNTADVTQPYNTEIGYLASTTGNITGIYDMSGGAWEYMMAIKADSSGNPYSGRNYLYNSGFNGNFSSPTSNSQTITSQTGKTNFPASKYYDLYNTNSSYTTTEYRILGDATGEMGPFSQEKGSWYDNAATFSNNNNPWFVRGGCYVETVNNGLFYFGTSDGHATYYGTYRIVLSPL